VQNASNYGLSGLVICGFCRRCRRRRRLLHHLI
jgi:hypothetical protein